MRIKKMEGERGIFLAMDFWRRKGGGGEGVQKSFARIKPGEAKGFYWIFVENHISWMTISFII